MIIFGDRSRTQIMIKQPAINELALLSDRSTCTILDQQGTIHWYCPSRFDGEAILSTLTDAGKGGYWSVELTGSNYQNRGYIDQSSVLRTTYHTAEGPFSICDFMPMGNPDSGILRRFSAVPTRLTSTLKIAGNYGLDKETVIQIDTHTVYFEAAKQYLYCSSPLKITTADTVEFTLENGQQGWAYLTVSVLNAAHFNVEERLNITLKNWRSTTACIKYEGFFKEEVLASVRAIQQLTYAATGGVLAAATMGLPEVIGGERNYDYRYVWVRDAALITGALSVLDADGKMEFRFLDFLHQAMKENTEKCIYPLYTIDYQLAKSTENLMLSGYFGSSPVQLGNAATSQLQLDAAANVLIACKIMYDKYQERPHWKTVKQVANYICENWEKQDNGIWEEGKALHYTSAKVLCARGLEMVASFNEDISEAERWMHNAGLIREFVHQNCMTTSGAFANYAGSEKVDISAVLFTLWDYTKPDSAEMKITIAEIEKNCAKDNLYRRTLVEFDAEKEGFFLAGSCWMAHYYAVAGNYQKSELILNAVKSCQNDLGFFSEEIAADRKQMLGNFGQTFVHSSFICAANGLTSEQKGIDTVIH